MVILPLSMKEKYFWTRREIIRTEIKSERCGEKEEGSDEWRSIWRGMKTEWHTIKTKKELKFKGKYNGEE